MSVRQENMNSFSPGGVLGEGVEGKGPGDDETPGVMPVTFRQDNVDRYAPGGFPVAGMEAKPSGDVEIPGGISVMVKQHETEGLEDRRSPVAGMEGQGPSDDEDDQYSEFADEDHQEELVRTMENEGGGAGAQHEEARGPVEVGDGAESGRREDPGGEGQGIRQDQEGQRSGMEEDDEEGGKPEKVEGGGDSALGGGGVEVGTGDMSGGDGQRIGKGAEEREEVQSKFGGSIEKSVNIRSDGGELEKKEVAEERCEGLHDEPEGCTDNFRHEVTIGKAAGGTEGEKEDEVYSSDEFGDGSSKPSEAVHELEGNQKAQEEGKAVRDDGLENCISNMSGEEGSGGAETEEEPYSSDDLGDSVEKGGGKPSKGVQELEEKEGTDKGGAVHHNHDSENDRSQTQKQDGSKGNGQGENEEEKLHSSDGFGETAQKGGDTSSEELQKLEGKKNAGEWGEDLDDARLDGAKNGRNDMPAEGSRGGDEVEKETERKELYSNDESGDCIEEGSGKPSEGVEELEEKQEAEEGVNAPHTRMGDGTKVDRSEMPKERGSADDQGEEEKEELYSSDEFVDSAEKGNGKPSEVTQELKGKQELEEGGRAPHTGLGDDGENDKTDTPNAEGSRGDQKDEEKKEVHLSDELGDSAEKGSDQNSDDVKELEEQKAQKGGETLRTALGDGTESDCTRKTEAEEGEEEQRDRKAVDTDYGDNGHDGDGRPPADVQGLEETQELEQWGRGTRGELRNGVENNRITRVHTEEEANKQKEGQGENGSLGSEVRDSVETSGGKQSEEEETGGKEEREKKEVEEEMGEELHVKLINDTETISSKMQEEYERGGGREEEEVEEVYSEFADSTEMEGNSNQRSEEEEEKEVGDKKEGVEEGGEDSHDDVERGEEIGIGKRLEDEECGGGTEEANGEFEDSAGKNSNINLGEEGDGEKEAKDKQEVVEQGSEKPHNQLGDGEETYSREGQSDEQGRISEEEAYSEFADSAERSSDSKPKEEEGVEGELDNLTGKGEKEDVIDQGNGVPHDELEDIAEPGSTNSSVEGGRGGAEEGTFGGITEKRDENRPDDGDGDGDPHKEEEGKHALVKEGDMVSRDEVANVAGQVGRKIPEQEAPGREEEAIYSEFGDGAVKGTSNRSAEKQEEEEEGREEGNGGSEPEYPKDETNNELWHRMESRSKETPKEEDEEEDEKVRSVVGNRSPSSCHGTEK